MSRVSDKRKIIWSSITNCKKWGGNRAGKHNPWKYWMTHEFYCLINHSHKTKLHQNLLVTWKAKIAISSFKNKLTWCIEWTNFADNICNNQCSDNSTTYHMIYCWEKAPSIIKKKLVIFCLKGSSLPKKKKWGISIWLHLVHYNTTVSGWTCLWTFF